MCHLAERPPSKAERAEQMRSAIALLDPWDIPDEALDSVHDAAKTSLDTVTALTEYEDAKASRLLTIVAFLSAAVTAVFARFSSVYSWPGALAWKSSFWLVAPTYCLFWLYLLIVTYGALRIFVAIGPTFNVPKTWGKAVGENPASMLFYQMILSVNHTAWARFFRDTTGENGHDLKQVYVKDFIIESYLVAEKVAVKVRVLTHGVRCLIVAMGLLLIYFVLCAASFAAVTPPVK